MDYGQWADHPLTIDKYLLGKGCSNPGLWTLSAVDKVVDKLLSLTDSLFLLSY
jgi:hypothetical protein